MSVNTSKLFSNVDKEEDHLKLLADLVDKSLTDPSVTRKNVDRVSFNFKSLIFKYRSNGKSVLKF